MQPDDRRPLRPHVVNPQAVDAAAPDSVTPDAEVFDAEPFDEDFQDLIEQSSLGTPGAGALRQRTRAADVDAVARISGLRDRLRGGTAMAGPGGDRRTATALVGLLRGLGHHRQADAVLAELHSDPAHPTTAAPNAASPDSVRARSTYPATGRGRQTRAAPGDPPPPRDRTDSGPRIAPGTDLPLASPAGQPTALRILLGSHLRRLRESAGVTREAAGYMIRASESKISRMELGRVGFKERDVTDLLDLYQVTDLFEFQTILRLARQANAPAWWHRYHDILPPWFQNYLGLEGAATTIRTYEVQFIPGLLQTPDYADAVIRLGHGQEAAADIRRRVQLRIDRQQILHRETPPAPHVHAVIDEAALRRPMGNLDILREQIQFLIDLTELPNVCLQIVPFHMGGRVAAGGAYTILGFQDHDVPDMVFVEQLTGALYLDKPQDRERYEQTFDQLGDEAESPECSSESLKKLLYDIDSR